MSGARPEPDLYDSHCHLNDPAFAGDLPAVLERAWRAGLAGALCVGYDLASSRAAVTLAEREPRLRAAVGVHPHSAADHAGGPRLRSLLTALRALAQAPEVVALGEMGLDFYRDLSPRADQETVFRAQVELALELGLPILVHDRDAHRETLAVLRDYFGPAAPPAAPAAPPANPAPPPAAPGVMHCFSGDATLAREVLKLGFYVSFAGPLTYPSAETARAAAAIVPADRVLVETDCPYLAPQAHRGRRNEPAYVAEVAAALAVVRGLPAEAVGRQTTANALRLFGGRTPGG